MPHPVIDQDLPCLTALQNGFTETPENIEQRPRLISAHLVENEVEIVPGDAAWIEYGSVRRLTEKATLSIADEVAQDYRSVGMNIYVSASGFRLQMFLDAIARFSLCCRTRTIEQSGLMCLSISMATASDTRNPVTMQKK